METIAQILSQMKTCSSTSPICDYRELQRKMAERENEMQGPGSCPLCKGKGYTRIFKPETDAWYTVPCSCQKAEKAKKRMLRSGLGDSLDRCTFGTWEPAEEWQRTALVRAQDYAAHPSGWFVMCGKPGTGKTHLCTAVCGKLLTDGRDVRYFRWNEDGKRLKASITDPAEYNALCDPFKAVDVLYVDDLFKGGNRNGSTGITAGDVNLAFELINSRYVTRKPTLISTELTVRDLYVIDEAIGSRIYEMAKLSGGVLEISKDRQNWRMR